jgi:hypothetical protein
MLQMFGQCHQVITIRMQLRRLESTAERFPERHHPGPD